jgi:hypothetical protein
MMNNFPCIFIFISRRVGCRAFSSSVSFCVSDDLNKDSVIRVVAQDLNKAIHALLLRIHTTYH